MRRLLCDALPMTDHDLLADFDQALAGTDQIVSGIRAGQWAVPTPCRGLDVRAVVGHLVAGQLVFTARVQGLPIPDRAADHLGQDPAAAFRRSGQALRQAFGGPGALRETYPGPQGPAPGVFLVQARIVELLGHGWDLARATGQSADYQAGLVERALAQARHGLADRPDGPGAPFAAEVAVPADAPVIDRLAGFLGRQP
jgi:uncharacterized protein (TIGR03086 family)